MEALKWIGYIVAATAVLSVVLGIVALLGTIVAIGAALVFVIGLVLFVAGIFKSL